MLNTSSITTWRVGRITARSRYRAQLKDMPDGLYAYWAEHAGKEFEGIPGDALFYARASEALLMFFDCVTDGEEPCALPSKAADSVWHAWQAMSPASLDAFCVKHFGRTIPHLEAEAMPVPLESALATCLVRARKLERLPRGGANLPTLFATDRALKMPHGFAYRLIRGKVGLSDMNKQGDLMIDTRFPKALLPQALVMSGMVHAWETNIDPRKKDQGSGDGSGTGSTDGGSACDGGSSGCSCGSGCGGGGCGGGG